MTLDEVVAHYGSAYALAKILRINAQNITAWKKRGGLIPYKHQIRLEHLTNGQLKAEIYLKEVEDVRYKPFYIACPHCTMPIDLDIKHKQLTKMELKPQGIDHGN